MGERWEETRLTFKASNQTVRDGVNKEVSNKHAMFTLLLTLRERGGEGREGGREAEGGDNGV